MTCEFREDLVQEIVDMVLQECASEGVEDRRRVARILMADPEVGGKLSWLERKEVVSRVAARR